MILEIFGIINQHNLSQQRVSLGVVENGNLEDYAIVDNTYFNGEQSNLHRHFYSFPNWDVKKGDVVILYTGEGKNHTENKVTDGNEKYDAHIFFWGLNVSVWNVDDTVHLLKVADSSSEHFTFDQ